MSSSSAARRNGGAGDEEGKQYPPPLASHDEVVRDPTVFWDTLRRFHFLMGTKFMIPVIGGKELDLHVLYVEVTRRSGYEKVVAEKKWREVGSVFKFSATTTSASFVLRKHYFSLLFHYEQLHFFQLPAPLYTPSPATGTAISPQEPLFNSPLVSGNGHSWRPELALVKYSPKSHAQGVAAASSSSSSSSCLTGKGTIDGKFDCGYLVSVKIGSEVLKGVLYYPEAEALGLGPPPSAHEVAMSSKGRRGGRRKRNKRRWDPNYPKPNRSGYNFFFADKHYTLKTLYPNREREFTKIIAHSWNNLSPQQRKVYQEISMRDKERYQRELTEYKEKMKAKADAAP